MRRALIAIGIAALAVGCSKTEPAPTTKSSKAEPATVPVGMASAEADAWLAERTAALEAFARTDAVSLRETVQRQRFFELAAEYDATAVYAGWEHDGHLVVSLDDVELPDGFDARDRPWYRRAVEEGGPVITEPYVDIGPEQMMVVTIATPIIRDDRLVAVLAMDFEMDTILAGSGSPADDTAHAHAL